MPKYRVIAEVVYVVDLPDEDTVYAHAEDTDLLDIERLDEVIVLRVREVE